HDVALARCGVNLMGFDELPGDGEHLAPAFNPRVRVAPVALRRERDPREHCGVFGFGSQENHAIRPWYFRTAPVPGRSDVIVGMTGSMDCWNGGGFNNPSIHQSIRPFPGHVAAPGDGRGPFTPRQTSV